MRSASPRNPRKNRYIGLRLLPDAGSRSPAGSARSGADRSPQFSADGNRSARNLAATEKVKGSSGRGASTTGRCGMRTTSSTWLCTFLAIRFARGWRLTSMTTLCAVRWSLICKDGALSRTRGGRGKPRPYGTEGASSCMVVPGGARRSRTQDGMTGGGRGEPRTLRHGKARRVPSWYDLRLSTFDLRLSSHFLGT